MNRSLLLAALFAAPLLAQENSPAVAKPLASEITAVTVYADRARVTRAAAVELVAGTHVYAFPKLPGWIDEGSVRVAVSGAELLDVQVAKTFLARPDDAAIRAAEAAVQDFADHLRALEDERAVLDAQQRQVDSIRAFATDKLPKDMAAREVKLDEYQGVVKFVAGALRDIAQARRELDRKRRELQPELDVRQRALAELRQRAQLEQRTVLITLRSTGAKMPTTATLTYMLPGASWEPVHELRAANGAAQVGLASFGVVTQTTGEDWEGVALTLSTQRSTETIRIPELEKLLVGGGRALPRLASGSSDTFSLATKNYSGQIPLWNAMVNAGTEQAEFDRNWRAQAGNQVIMVQRFEQLQEQRGTTAHFAALAVQTVRTDGRPVRVPVGATQVAARTKIVAAPEASLNAARIATLAHAGLQPLLPGKVQLFVDGAFLGTTETEFVAPGESFDMFLGVADTIKLSRQLDKKRSALSWSGKRKKMQVHYVVTVENLGAAEAVIQLAERVPVSEADDVRVQNVRLTPVAKPDTQGLVKWDVKLVPKQAQEFRVEYTLDYPADFAARPAAGDSGGTPAPADLQERIRHLEKSL